MTDEMNAVQHLEAAARLVREEHASISVVGRPLTPEEERRLQALETAEVDIESAIGHLTGLTDGHGVNLPADGRYAVGNDALAVELRIDLAGSNIISGDIFSAVGGFREYVASFRSEPGAEITPVDNPLEIVAEDRDGKHAQGEVLFGSADVTDITMTLLLDAALIALPVNQTMTFAGRFEGDAMRELGVELESEIGIDPLPEWDFNGEAMTVEKSFANAGFDVFNVGFRSQFPSPSSGKWDTSQLHGLMAQFAQEPIDRKSWNLHLLLLEESTLGGLLGVMFDSGEADVNQLPRQGAAVFQRPIKTRPDWPRKLIQTTVHELGHALNLAHRFERPVGRADSTSFMNYDWKYLGGMNADRFWREFDFTFDADEVAFLRHGPLANVIPGGAEFHTIPYWENPDGGYVPYIPEIPSDDFRIRLLPPASGTLFQFGQPVLLTVELTNNTGRTMELPRFLLDPKAGFFELVVKRRTSPASGGTPGPGMVFRPIIHRCFDMDLAAADEVPQGGTLVDNVNLTFGSAGFTFIEPGDYEVTAVFMWQKAFRDIRTIKSAPLSIRVAYPKTDEEEREGQELFRRDVGVFFALGGSDALSDAEDVLDAIVDRRQHRAKTVTDPLVANILRSKAINQARDFIHYRNGKYRKRSANLEKAQAIFSSISNVTKKIFDPQTSSATAKFAAAIKKEGKGKK